MLRSLAKPSLLTSAILVVLVCFALSSQAADVYLAPAPAGVATTDCGTTVKPCDSLVSAVAAVPSANSFIFSPGSYSAASAVSMVGDNTLSCPVGVCSISCGGENSVLSITSGSLLVSNFAFSGCTSPAISASNVKVSLVSIVAQQSVLLAASFSLPASSFVTFSEVRATGSSTLFLPLVSVQSLSDTVGAVAVSLNDSSFSGCSSRCIVISLPNPLSALSLSNTTFAGNTLSHFGVNTTFYGGAALLADVSVVSFSGGSVYNNSVSLSGLALGTDDVVGGGAIMIVDSNQISIQGGQWYNNSLSITSCTGYNATLHIGGGALLIQSQVAAPTVLIGDTLFASNSVVMSDMFGYSVFFAGGAVFSYVNSKPLLQLVSTTFSANSVTMLRCQFNASFSVGGMALGVRMFDGDLTLDVTGITVMGNVLAVASLTGECAVMTFGGSIFVLNDAAVHALVSNSQFSQNSVSLTGVFLLSAHVQGGGAGFLLFSDGEEVTLALTGCVFTNNLFTAPSLTAANGLVGGVGFWSASGTYMVINVTSTTFSSNLVTVLHSTTSISLEMCGAACGLSDTYITTTIQNSFFLQNVGDISEFNSFTTLTRGSALTFTALGTATILMENSTVSDNIARADSGFSVVSQNCGSMSIGANSFTYFTAVNCDFSLNTLSAEYSTGSDDLNGGAAALIGSYFSDTVVTVQNCTFTGSSILVDGASAVSNAIGGALDVVGQNVTVDVHLSSFTGNSILGIGTASFAGTVNELPISQIGGAALFISSLATATVNIDKCSFLSNSLSIPLSSSANKAYSGGGALMILSDLGVRSSLTNCVFKENSVNSSNAVAYGAQANGGGAVYIFGYFGVQSSFVANLWMDNTLFGDGSLAPTGGNSNGGGALSINSPHASIVYSSVDEQFISNSLSLRYCNGSSNLNGGGAVYIYSGEGVLATANIIASFSNDTFTNSFGQFDDTVAVPNMENATINTGTNQNGGGAIYINSGGELSMVATHCTLSQNSVSIPNAVTPESQQNGGAAIYLNGNDDISLFVENSHLVANLAHVPGGLVLQNVSNVNQVPMFGSNANGGSALYMNAAGVVSFTSVTSSFENNLSNVTNSQGFINFNGGAVYLLSLSDVVISILDSVFAGNVFHAAGTRGQENANGGSALYALALAGKLTLTSANSLLANNSVYSNDVACQFVSGSLNSNGGGAFQLVVPTDGMIYTSTNDTVTNNSVQSSNNFAFENLNGGGGVQIDSLGHVNMTVNGGRWTNNTMTARNATALSTVVDSDAINQAGTNQNGGGAVYVNCYSADVSFTGTVFDSNNLLAPLNTASAASYNGGSGFYLNALEGVNLTFVNTTFLNNYVDVTNSTVYGIASVAVPTGINENGGAIYAITDEDVHLTVSSSAFIANTVDSRFAFANSSNANGGAVFIDTNGSILAKITDNVFVDNFMRASYGTAVSVNSNGGGAFALISNSTASVMTRNNRYDRNYVECQANFAATNGNGGSGILILGNVVQFQSSNDEVRNNTVSASGSSTSSNNGGAFYLISASDSTASVVNSVFSGNVLASESAISSRSISGGAALAVNSSSTFVVSLVNSTFAGNLANFSNNQQQGSNIGGGALYVHGITGSVDLQSCLFNLNTMLSPRSQTSFVSYCGGGAFYLHSQLAVALNMSQSDFIGNSVDMSASTQGTIPNANGGGGIYVFSPAGPITVTGQQVSTVSNVFNAGAGVSVSQMFSGGGSMIFVAPASTVSVTLSNCNLTANMAINTGIGTSLDDLYAGGGAAMLVAGYQATLLTTDTIWDSNVVQGDHSFSAANSYIGGGALMLWTLESGSTTLISVNISNCVFSNNRATQFNVSGTPAYVGGGALFLYSDFVPLQLSVLGSSFDGNIVLTDNTLNIPVLFALQSYCGGGAVYLSDSEACGLDEQCAVIQGCTFTRNAVMFVIDQETLAANLIAGGGALFSRTASVLLLQDSSFTGNSVVGEVYGSGGAIYIAGPMVLTSVKLIDNQAGIGGAVFTSAYVQASVITATGNTAGRLGGAFVFMAGQSTLTDSLLQNNHANLYGGALYVSMIGAISLQNCQVLYNSASSGGGVAISDQGVVQSNSCVYMFNSAGFSGGVFYSELEATVTLNSDYFYQSTSGRGGAVLGGGYSVVNAVNVNFTQSHGVDFGNSVVVWDICTSSFIGCLFDGGAGYQGELFISDLAVSNVTDCVFQNGYSEEGGGIYIAANAFGYLNNVTFHSNTAAQKGGGLYITESAYLSMINVLFYNNYVQQPYTYDFEPGGGGLWFSSSTPPYFQNVSFIGNSASVGGGVYLVGEADDVFNADVLYPFTTPNSLFFSRNVAYNISYAGSPLASGGGGGIYFDFADLDDPSEAVAVVAAYQAMLTNNLFDDTNIAIYGARASSSMFSVSVSISGSTAPGTKVPVVAVALDTFGNAVATLSQASLVLSVTCAENPQSCRSVSDAEVINRGLVTFNWNVFGQVGAYVDLSIAPLGSSMPYFNTTIRRVYIDDCAVGTGFNTQLETCEVCPFGTYSLQTNQLCQACPVNADCFGGNSTFVIDGYWPYIDPANSTFTPILCPFDWCSNRPPTAISPPGDGDVLNSTTLCQPQSFRNGSTILCGGCLEGFSIWGYQCVQCSGFSASETFVVFAGYFALTLGQRIGAQSVGGSVGLKSLIFVYQFAQLTSYPTEIFPFPSTISHYLDQARGVVPQCPFFTSAQDQIAVTIVEQLVQVAILAGMYFAHKGLSWLLIRLNLFTSSKLWFKVVYTIWWTSNREGYIRTASVLAINLYVVFLQMAFDFIVCEPITNAIYHYPTLSCVDYQGTRLSMQLLLAFFGLLPFLLAGFLWFWRRRYSSLEKLELYIPSLYISFKEKYFFWEAFLLLRRYILLVVFSALSTTNTNGIAIGKSVMVMVICVFLSIQWLVQPFDTYFNNVLDQLSLMGLLAFLGIFSRSDLSHDFQLAAGFIILAALALIFIYPSLRSVWEVLQELFSVLRAETAAAEADGDEEGEELGERLRSVSKTALNSPVLRPRTRSNKSGQSRSLSIPLMPLKGRNEEESFEL